MCDKEYQVSQICLWVSEEQCFFLWSMSSIFHQLDEQADLTVTCDWEILMQIQKKRKKSKNIRRIS